MDSFLQVGDIFTSASLGSKLHGQVAADEKYKHLVRYNSDTERDDPYVVFSRLHTEDYTTVTVVYWKETNEDGWYRDRQTELSTKCTDATLTEATWVVTKTQLTGGGNNGRPYDDYPDGHRVVARRVGGTEIVEFYQSGCFRGMILPEEITKL
jgi:hypothetical protein